MIKTIQSMKIGDLIKAFPVLEFVAGPKSSIKRNITSGLIIQPGLELSGFYLNQYRNHIYLLGNREKVYLDSFNDKAEVLKRFKKIFELNPPIMIFDVSFPCPADIIEMAKGYSSVVLQVKKDGQKGFMYHLQNFLSETFAPHDEVHASGVSVFGNGVLIMGDSGLGKSEVTLELVKKRHLFICDDRVVLKRVGWNIQASSPEIIKDLIEIRGIGILDVKKMFGVQACLNSSKVNLIVRLKMWDPEEPIDRLGEKIMTKTILGVEIPYYELPLREGRAMSELIETTVISHMLKVEGINSILELNKRIINLQKKGE